MTVFLERSRPARRVLRLGLLGLPILVACAGGGGHGPDSPGPVATVTLTPNPDTVLVAAASQLGAVARDSAGTVIAGASFTWNSANAGIAAVSATGQVTGVAAGQASVTATADGVTGGATVVVRAPAGNSVVVSPGSDSVPVGSVIQLHATVFDANAQPIPGVAVTWSTGNSGIATVGPSGRVTGVAAGSTAVTATYGAASGSGQLKVRSAFTRGDGAFDPIMDMTAGTTYQSFDGGLYPGGNTMPTAHRAAGIAFAQQVVPLNTLGQPNAAGTVVLMSIGYSNATQEWCAQNYSDPCTSWSFTGKASADPAVRASGLAILNGAKASQTVNTWTSSGSPNFDRVRDSVLAPRGLTEKQVQVVWFKIAHPDPTISLPRANADAFTIVHDAASALRAMRIRYPNLKLVFMASRTYGGYANTLLNPEPYAYESGFSVKWLIDAQIREMATGGATVDPVAGDLSYTTGVAPWVAWGPYLWTNGAAGRSDGLQWLLSDVEADGTHPSTAGETKVANLLLQFFKAQQTTKCWFITGGSCP
jgi:hypothetical protein